MNGKNTAPRYAKGTSVSVEKTRAEIDVLLSRHGAAKRSIGSDDERAEAYVFFVLANRQIRLTVPLPRPQDIPSPRWSGKTSTAEARRRALEQATRERWRSVLLLLKAKLEAIALGQTTAEREFLADIYLPDGRRVGEALGPLLEEAYATGKGPRLLPPAAEEGP